VNYHKKIVAPQELQETVQKAKAAGKVVVQCHGCFDILHPGHLRYLTWAKERGDLLIVSVSADNVIHKGNFRPYVPQDLRAENLAALEVVDYVTIDDGEWAGPILELLKPNIYVKGKEFENVSTGRIGRERQLVESYGGKVLFSSGDVVYSSTKLIEEHQDRLAYADDQVRAYCKRHGITRQRLEEVMDAFQGKNILVVGDAIVDRYVHCDRLGMSADAPVLVVRPTESDTFLGGAGIVAGHAQSLGATARFCTVIGGDADGEYVRKELARRNIAADLVVDTLRPTTLKTRYLSDGKKLLNVNQFRDHNLDLPVATQLLECIQRAGETADAIVICDFSYGVITSGVLDAVCAIGSKRKVPVIGDVQCSSQMGNVTRMKGVTLTTPSEREARVALCDRESGVADLGAMILTQTGNESLIITLGERGLMIFDTSGSPLGEECKSLPLYEIKKRMQPEYLPSFATFVTDAMGAGDALLATISCCLAAGAGMLESAFLANCAAAVECRKMGNTEVRREEILEILDTQLSPTAP
jgi:rfaE bifunctional protein kinase chain/domain/rfaE bifunctional protein nucleotidyltransferase chain/domain